MPLFLPRTYIFPVAERQRSSHKRSGCPRNPRKNRFLRQILCSRIVRSAEPVKVQKRRMVGGAAVAKGLAVIKQPLNVWTYSANIPAHVRTSTSMPKNPGRIPQGVHCQGRCIFLWNLYSYAPRPGQRC